MTNLEEVRKEISEIDAALSPLLAGRLRLAADVAAAKKATGKAVDDPAREQAVLDGVAAGLEPDIADGVRAVYRAIFTASKALQRRAGA